MAKIKAMTNVQINEVLEKKYGANCHEQLRPHLSVEDWNFLYGKKLLAISWIDLDLIMRDTKAKIKVFGKDDPKWMEDLLEEMAINQFSGIYKFFIRIASPKAILQKSSRLWRNYYDSGNLTCEMISDNQAVLKLTDFPDIPKDHEIIYLPFTKGILKLTGAKDIELVHKKCIARGDDACITEVSWR